jgi:RND family efflux transporter MFP subunit
MMLNIRLPFDVRFGRLGVVGFVAVLVVGLGACSEKSKQASGPSAEIPVVAYTATETSVQDRIAGTGTIAALRTTDIGPRVDGIVDQILVRVGDSVAADQPLFRIRQREYELSVKELEQKFAQAKADLAKAERDEARTADLKARGVASQTSLNDVATKLEQAKALTGVAAAQLDRARQALADTIVRAPYAGVITRRNVDEGAFMNARAVSMPGGASSTTAVQIMEIDTVAAIVQVPSIYVGRLNVGTPAKVRIDGFDDAWDATVAVVNDRVEPSTRTVEVRLAIPNKDRRIKPGLYTRVDLLPPARTTLAIDRRVVQGAEGDRYVFLNAGGIARKRTVITRDLDAARVEIVEGLANGEAALGGPNIGRVIDGSPIAPTPAPAA